MDFTALIAAGGKANRLGALPCSKEIFPLIGQFTGERIKVVCENLIEYYKSAGITNIHYIIRSGKWDIPQLLGDGSSLGVNISYLIMNLPFGTPFTLDQAYPFIKHKNIAMGFPDMIVKPSNFFVDLKKKLLEGDSDVVLGLFPIQTYWKWDMISFEGDTIKELVIKGDNSELKYGWSNCVWRPTFTEFMHEYLKNLIKTNPKGTRVLPDGVERELFVGDVITEAMNSGLKVDYVIFENGSSIDIGTHEEMINYIKSTSK